VVLVMRRHPAHTKANNMKTTHIVACVLALSGVLVSPGVLGQTQPTVSRQIFLGADLNKDGFVDLEEFHKDIVRGFHALDHDRDGYISADEIRSIPDKTRVDFLLRLLKRGDKSGDVRLSFKEVVEARMAFFDRADVDKDERLSMTEVIAYDSEAIRRANASLAAAQKTGGTRK
jgi:Ca2+-binding EF-hand superfamily protein